MVDDLLRGGGLFAIFGHIVFNTRFNRGCLTLGDDTLEFDLVTRHTDRHFAIARLHIQHQSVHRAIGQTRENGESENESEKTRHVQGVRVGVGLAFYALKRHTKSTAIRLAVLDTMQRFMSVAFMDTQADTTIRTMLGQQSLVLVGLMGAGKSAIGRKVASRLDLPFVDADTEIEKAAKQTIPEIFDTYGEDEFRRVEQRVIERLMGEGPQVLATGGGAFMNEQTRACIRRDGISIWLSAKIDLLMERVSRKANRPLLKNPDPRGVMISLIEQRYPIYAKADIEVPSKNISKDEMAGRVIDSLARHFASKDDER